MISGEGPEMASPCFHPLPALGDHHCTWVTAAWVTVPGTTQGGHSLNPWRSWTRATRLLQVTRDYGMYTSAHKGCSRPGQGRGLQILSSSGGHAAWL